jgi:DNA primase
VSPRYKENIAEIVLDRVNIVDVISSYTPLTKAGKNHKALCPFHSEKSPSFIVSEDKQLYHCFGCGQAGSAIQFIMNKENLSFIETIEHLAERFHVDLDPYILDVGEVKKEGVKVDLYPILREAAKFYYKNLHNGDNPGMTYFKKRNLTGDIMRSFGLGYAAEGWSHLIQHFKSTGISYQNLLDVGLIVQKDDRESYYDRFRYRVMFPIFDTRGRIVGFGGRVLDDSKPKYLNSPETPVFNKSKTLYGLNIARQNIGPQKRIILAEGYMDVIALHQAGFKNSVATLGTAITKDHGQMLARIYDEVIIAYDSDDAGQTATQKALEILKGLPVKTRVLIMKNAKDPDEFVEKFGVRALGEAIDDAQTGFEFQTQVLKSRHDLSKPEEKLDFIQSAITMLKDAKNPIEMEYYVNHIASQTGVTPDLLIQSYKEQRGHLKKTPELKDDDPILIETHREIRGFNKIEEAILSQVIQEPIYLHRFIEKIGFVLKSYPNVFSDTIFDLQRYYEAFKEFAWEDAASQFDVDQLTLFQTLSNSKLNKKDDLKAFEKLMLTYEKSVYEHVIKTIDNSRFSLNTLNLSIEDRRQREGDLLRKRDLISRELSRVIKEQTKS